MESLFNYYGAYTVRNHRLTFLGVEDEFDVDSLHPTFGLRVIVECKQLVDSKFKKDYINTFSDKMNNAKADFGVLCTTSDEDLSRFLDYCYHKKIFLWDYDAIIRVISEKERVNFMNLFTPFSIISFIDNLPYFKVALDDRLDSVKSKSVSPLSLVERLKIFASEVLPYCLKTNPNKSYKVCSVINNSLKSIESDLNHGLSVNSNLSDVIHFFKTSKSNLLK